MFTSDVYNTNLTAVDFTPGAAVVTAADEGGSGTQFNWCVSGSIFPVGDAFTISPYLNQSLCLDWGFDDNDNAWAMLSSGDCATIDLKEAPAAVTGIALSCPAPVRRGICGQPTWRPLAWRQAISDIPGRYHADRKERNQ